MLSILNRRADAENTVYIWLWRSVSMQGGEVISYEYLFNGIGVKSHQASICQGLGTI